MTTNRPYFPPLYVRDYGDWRSPSPAEIAAIDPEASGKEFEIWVDRNVWYIGFITEPGELVALVFEDGDESGEFTYFRQLSPFAANWTEDGGGSIR